MVVVVLSSIISQAKLETVIHAFVFSRLDYFNSLFTCLNKASLEHLQTVQNTAARLLTKPPKFCHVTLLLVQLQSTRQDLGSHL